MALRLIIVLFVLCLFGLNSYAQPEDPPDPEVPISGIEYLLGAGAIYGLKKSFARRKTK